MVFITTTSIKKMSQNIKPWDFFFYLPPTQATSHTPVWESILQETVFFPQLIAAQTGDPEAANGLRL